MAINKTILEHIEALEISKQEKQLLKELLEQQERGSRQYTKQYTEIIKEYLERQKQ